MKTKLALMTLLAAMVMPSLARAADIDWSKVRCPRSGNRPSCRAMCTATACPRSDLRVMLDGVAIKPALALGGWVAFCLRWAAKRC